MPSLLEELLGEKEGALPAEPQKPAETGDFWTDMKNRYNYTAAQAEYNDSKAKASQNPFADQIKVGKISGIKDYYPKNVNPIHEVRDWSKVRSMIRSSVKGEDVPPIIRDGDNLLTGTHRSAANDVIDMLIERGSLPKNTRKIPVEKFDPESVPDWVKRDLENDDFRNIDDFFVNRHYKRERQ